MSLEEVVKNRPERESREEISLKSGETRVVVLLKGATVSRWTIGETEILYPYQTIQTDKGPKIRGGIPILFPIAGLPEKTGRFSKLSQHGFARDMLWTEFYPRLGDDKTILELHADRRIKKQYPFDFGLATQITIEEDLLKCELVVANNGRKDSLPFVFGLHPYFQISPEERQRMETNISGFEPDDEKLKEALIFDWQREVKIEIPGKGLITMKPSLEFKKLVIWTDGKGDYICFEPWTSGPFTIDKEGKRITLPPGKDIKLSLEMQFQQPSGL